MEFHTVLAKIKQANTVAGDHFFLMDVHDIDFGFSSLVSYPPNAMVGYQGNLFLRNTRMAGYTPGVLPTNATFFTPAAVGGDLANKLTAKFVSEFPANPVEEVMYINTATGVTQAFKNGVYVPVGQPPVATGPDLEFDFPVPIMLGFNTNLDTPHHTRMHFAGRIFKVNWDIDPTAVTGTTFTPQLVGQPAAAPLNTIADLQIWIDDFTTATTPFYVTVTITLASGAEGEITGTFTHRKTVSVPTVTTVSGATGWASYKDNQYTEQNPFRLLAGVETVLPNNAGIVLEDQLPVGVPRFYDAATQKLVADRSGDGMNYQFVMMARPTVANAKIDFGVDIGGSFGKIFNSNYTVAVDAGVTDKVHIPVAGGYTGDTFFQNGGQVKVTASQDVDVWGMTYIPSRYHQAR